MTVPTIDTFENDIVDEIRHKEASITDIASAVGDIGNTPTETKTSKSPSFLVIIVVVLTFCGIVGVGYVGYLYYNQENLSSLASLKKNNLIEQKKNHSGVALKSISPTLDQALGTSLSTIEKTTDGYSISILSYPTVFAYMLKNENEFGDELGLAVGNIHAEKNNSTTTISIQATTTSSFGTSTQIKTTSTTTSEVKNTQPSEYIFSDITISNQNMRVATSLYGTVAYAFIGTQKLVISSSTDGILSLRSKALHK